MEQMFATMRQTNNALVDSHSARDRLLLLSDLPKNRLRAVSDDESLVEEGRKDGVERRRRTDEGEDPANRGNDDGALVGRGNSGSAQSRCWQQ